MDHISLAIDPSDLISVAMGQCERTLPWVIRNDHQVPSGKENREFLKLRWFPLDCEHRHKVRRSLFQLAIENISVGGNNTDITPAIQRLRRTHFVIPETLNFARNLTTLNLGILGIRLASIRAEMSQTNALCPRTFFIFLIITAGNRWFLFLRAFRVSRQIIL